jgi:phytanoyl-CoA hydroxylase
MAALRVAQVKEFFDHGVTTVENILQDRDLDPVINTMSEFIDRRARELKEEGKIADLCEDEPFLTRFAHIFAQCEEIGRGMDIYELRAKAMFDFLRNHRLIDAVESILGGDISCSPIQHIRAKPPARLNDTPGFNVPWHQDSGVSWEESDQTVALTCWIPLVDATVERGCLEVIPDVIQTGHLEHEAGGGTHIKPDLMPDTERFQAEVKKGDVIFLSQFTPHRSTPNLTEWDTRWSLDLRYVAYGQPTGRPFFPDFCVRSRNSPDRVLTDHERWSRMWVKALEEQKQNPQPAHRI